MGEGEEFHFGNVDFEKSIRNSKENIEETVGCLELIED